MILLLFFYSHIRLTIIQYNNIVLIVICAWRFKYRCLCTTWNPYSIFRIRICYTI
nr:MAG TPA_asm: hypothetical protein [Bacteriophage sp.]